MKFISSFIIISIVIFSLFFSLIFVSSKIFLHYDMEGLWITYRPFFIIQILVLFLAGIAIALIWIYGGKKLSYIENEDWPGLASYMETRILDKGRLSGKNLKLFLNSHFLSGDFETVKSSIPVIRNKNPDFFNKNRANLGYVYILTKEYRQAADFFEDSCSTVKENPLLRFFYGYSLYASNQKEAAVKNLFPLLESDNPLFKLLSAYGIKRIMDLSFIFLGEEKKNIETSLEKIKKELKPGLTMKKSPVKTCFLKEQKEVYCPAIKPWYEKSLLWLKEE